MSIDYITTLLPKYINDVKSLYNLLFLCKSVYDKSLKIKERIKKRYTLEPYTRANIIIVNISLNTINCLINDKHNDDKNHVCEYIDLETFTDNEFHDYNKFHFIHHVTKISNYVLNNYSDYLIKKNIKRGDIVMLSSLYRYEFFMTHPNYTNDYLPDTGMEDLYMYDGKTLVSIADVPLNISFVKFSGVNENFLVNEFHINYYSHLFGGSSYNCCRIINLYKNKIELQKKLIIHEDYYYAETCCDNYTLILVLEKNPKNLTSMKKKFIKYINNIEEQNIRIENIKSNNYYTSIDKKTEYYIYTQPSYYYSTMKYSQKNIVLDVIY